VLDTNVVLDWLLFHDASTKPLVTAIRNGARVLASPAALDELERVLAYPQLNLAAEVRRRVRVEYESHATILSGVVPPSGLPRCRDADDQHFLELAAFAHADMLVSRDKALLKLRSKMRRFGVSIVDPLAAARLLIERGNRP
jgi:putative PIN family toxin of toxin-antitoxin system